MFAQKTQDDQLQETAWQNLEVYLQKNDDPDGGVREIALWIPARTALKSKDRQELGRKLAARAHAAAANSGDDRWLMAILKEQGDIAIAAGDKPAAEKAWSGLLDAVLAGNTGATSGTVTRPTSQSGSQSGSALEELRRRLLNQSPPKTSP